MSNHFRPEFAPVHPWAWWAWALSLAGAISTTTNPLVLALLTLGITAVVLLRRSDAPWARSVGAYFVLAGFVIVVRVVFQLLVGASRGATVLFRLPEIALPAWAAGIRLGGPVTAEAMSYTLYDGLRLGAMLLCLGAANGLANPRQALRSVPAALYEASVAVVIALSVAPQLVESTQRIRRARRLRGGAGTGWKAVAGIVIPVLEDAIERSMGLAAGMEARGFARTRTGVERRGPLALMLASIVIATFGGFLLLGTVGMLPLAVGCLVVGAAGVAAGLRIAGRRLRVTRYRPQHWTLRDTGIAACGMATVILFVVLAALNPAALNPSTDPLVWPDLHPAVLVALVCCLLPLVLATRPKPRPAPNPEVRAGTPVLREGLA